MHAKRKPGRPRERELGPFGRRLRELIEQSGRFDSRAAFLRELNIPAPTMYRYETGERPPPAPLVAEMARALGVSTDELLGVPLVVRKARAEAAADDYAEVIERQWTEPTHIAQKLHGLIGEPSVELVSALLDAVARIDVVRLHGEASRELEAYRRAKTEQARKYHWEQLLGTISKLEGAVHLYASQLHAATGVPRLLGSGEPWPEYVPDG